MQDSKSGSVAGRRKLLKALAAGGGAAAITNWQKPVVDAVILPAHAQATGLAMTCVATPPNGTKVGPNELVSVVVSIAPPPPTGSSIELAGFCDGVGPQFTGLGVTDDRGEYATSGKLDFCGAGQTATVRFSFANASADCYWIVR